VNTLRRYPVLFCLICIQVLILGIGVIATRHLFISAVDSQKRAVFPRAKNSVLKEVLVQHEQWRAWAHFGDQQALGDVAEEMRERFPIKTIQVLKRDQVKIADRDQEITMIVPETDDNTVEEVVMVTLDEQKLFKEYNLTNSSSLVAMVLVASLVVSSVISFLFVRRYLYQPVQQITGLLAQESKSLDDALRISPAFGEIKSFIGEVLRVNLAYRKAREAEAIARTTQMLAHDVRKPFSLLESTLRTLESINNPSQLVSLSKSALPEVRSAIQSVEGMIADIMEIGIKKELTLKPTSLTAIVLDVINDHLAHSEALDISLSYDFRHIHLPLLHAGKFTRVVSNIVTNALQAMAGQGRLRFATHEIPGSRDMLQLSIANTNSYIPPEARSRIFEDFFSDGKQNGTGLGLAIAKKMVIDHGGEIWCNSDPTLGTEFIMTIPLSKELQDNFPKLLRSSHEVRAIHRERLEMQQARIQNIQTPSYQDKRHMEKGPSPCDEDRTLVLPIITDETQSDQNRPTTQSMPEAECPRPKIVVVDDIWTFRRIWDEIKEIDVTSFCSPNAFREAYSDGQNLQQIITCLIVDNNFGSLTNETGLEFARSLRESGFANPIFLSTNENITDGDLQGIINRVESKNAEDAWAEIKQDLSPAAPSTDRIKELPPC
jgi:signal transduction histidine kinase